MKIYSINSHSIRTNSNLKNTQSEQASTTKPVAFKSLTGTATAATITGGLIGAAITLAIAGAVKVIDMLNKKDDSDSDKSKNDDTSGFDPSYEESFTRF